MKTLITLFIIAASAFGQAPVNGNITHDQAVAAISNYQGYLAGAAEASGIKPVEDSNIITHDGLLGAKAAYEGFVSGYTSQAGVPPKFQPGEVVEIVPQRAVVAAVAQVSSPASIVGTQAQAVNANPIPAPTATSAASPLPSSFYGGGVAYSTPGPALWANYSVRIQSSKFYSTTSIDVTSSQKGSFLPQTSLRTGLALVAYQFPFKGRTLSVLGLTELGGAVGATPTPAPSTMSLGAAFAGGGAVIIPLGASGWDIVPALRIIKTNVGGATTDYVFEIGIGQEKK